MGSSSPSSGGKGNSRSNTASTTSTATEQTTINTVDSRAVQGDNAIFGGNVNVHSAGDNLSIVTTDQGAVAAGLDIALESLAGLERAFSGAIGAQRDTARDVASQAFSLAEGARQSETSGAIQSFLKYGAVVLVVIAVAYMATRGK